MAGSRSALAWFEAVSVVADMISALQLRVSKARNDLFC